MFDVEVGGAVNVRGGVAVGDRAAIPAPVKVMDGARFDGAVVGGVKVGFGVVVVFVVVVGGP